MLVASITAWGHYLVLLVFPVAYLAVCIGGAPTIQRVVSYAVVAVLLNLLGTWSNPYLDHHLLSKVILNYLPLYGLIWMGVLLVTTNATQRDSQ